MSKICDVCGKTFQKGNLVPRGVGRRVTRRTITQKQPNLRIKRFIIDGNTVKVRLCASCLKRIKYEEKLAEVNNKADVKVDVVNA
jgi:ribosomal protein L28